MVQVAGTRRTSSKTRNTTNNEIFARRATLRFDRRRYCHLALKDLLSSFFFFLLLLLNPKCRISLTSSGQVCVASRLRRIYCRRLASRRTLHRRGPFHRPSISAHLLWARVVCPCRLRRCIRRRHRRQRRLHYANGMLSRCIQMLQAHHWGERAAHRSRRACRSNICGKW